MFILVAIAAALASPAPCRITVHPAAVSHAISDLTMGCHSDPGYAHQSRGLSAEMLVGNAFELVPDAPLVPPPKAGYRCAWDGVFHTFNTHGGGAGDVEIETSGRTDAEKDADCCARCDCEPLCEFWQRDDGSNSCSLRRSFAGFDNSSGKSTVRGNFKNASKGSCEVADALLLSNSGWLSRGKMGHATLDSSSSPVPQGLWAPPSRSLLLASAGDGAVNRGFGGEGLFLQPGKEYDGYLVLKSSAPTTVTVSLRPFGGGAALATANVKFAGGNWSAAKFTLMPSAGTSCVGVSAAEARAASISCPVNNTYVSMDGGWGRNSAAPGGMSDLTAHVCVQCGGEFTLAKLSGGAEVRVGFASLTPGAWGRYKGSTARKDSVEALQKMGVKMMRSGGSVACDPTMAWTSWRGPMWQRPSASTQGNWVHSLVSGWGLFEVIDMASAAGITPIITLFGGMSGEDGHAAKRCQEMENGTKDRYGDKACDLKSAAYGDLLEYCHGDDGTEFGKLRHDDGHPDIFNVSIFELGNEQYNANFADQVAAMESRAKKIGLAPKTLRYLWPQGPGDSPGRPSFAPSAADAKAINALGLGSRIMSDIHGPAIGGVAKAEQVFSTAATKHWGAMNLETNCGDHTMHRALTEARDLNLFHRYPNPKLQGRAGSFCMERSGYNEGFANDQGLAFFLPNMTFLQPPGFVHAMISETWQPNAVNFTLSAGCAALNVSAGDVSASASADGKQATLRVVNENAAALQVAASLGGGADSSAQASVLEGSACAKDPTFPYVSEHKRCSNTPGEPTLFSPSTWAESGSGTGTTVPGYSFAVFKLKSDDAESANTATLTIGAASHRTRRMDMGCHSDSGCVCAC